MIVRYYVVEGGIRVYYEPELDGGTAFGQMFVPILRRLGLVVLVMNHSPGRPS